MDQIPYRLPLVIGATGHRDLRDQDIPALEAAVAEAIKRLKQDYLHDDKETPLIVLSSLAEGADRLIARVAMARGGKLIAPLPMEAGEYRRDFEPGLKPDAAAAFDELREQALAAPATGLSRRPPHPRPPSSVCSDEVPFNRLNFAGDQRVTTARGARELDENPINEKCPAFSLR